MIVDADFSPAHLEVVGQTNLLVVAHWRHVLLFPGERVELNGEHRGAFIREVTRQEYEERIRAAGALEWLDPPADAHFWEVAFD